jgi:signal peptidase II
VAGGALGTLLDRVRFAAVVDFIDFRVWPVFNIADVAITVGVAVLLFQLVRRSETAEVG